MVSDKQRFQAMGETAETTLLDPSGSIQSGDPSCFSTCAQSLEKMRLEGGIDRFSPARWPLFVFRKYDNLTSGGGTISTLRSLGLVAL
jgi:hypothetical protein